MESAAVNLSQNFYVNRNSNLSIAAQMSKIVIFISTSQKKSISMPSPLFLFFFLLIG